MRRDWSYPSVELNIEAAAINPTLRCWSQIDRYRASRVMFAYKTQGRHPYALIWRRQFLLGGGWHTFAYLSQWQKTRSKPTTSLHGILKLWEQTKSSSERSMNNSLSIPIHSLACLKKTINKALWANAAYLSSSNLTKDQPCQFTLVRIYPIITHCLCNWRATVETLCFSKVIKIPLMSIAKILTTVIFQEGKGRPRAPQSKLFRLQS